MAKYHLNMKGQPGKCSATTRACPFGGESDHYDSPEAAYAGLEASYGGAFGGEASADSGVAAYAPAPNDTPEQLAHKADVLRGIVQTGTTDDAIAALDASLEIHNVVKNTPSPILTPRPLQPTLSVVQQAGFATRSLTAGMQGGQSPLSTSKIKSTNGWFSGGVLQHSR